MEPKQLLKCHTIAFKYEGGTNVLSPLEYIASLRPLTKTGVYVVSQFLT